MSCPVDVLFCSVGCGAARCSSTSTPEHPELARRVAVTVPLGTPPYDADVRGADTPLASHRRQIEVYRAMEPARRVELAVEMSDEVWELAADGVRSRHPGYDQQTVMWAVRRMRLGDQLFGRVWPDAPLVAP